MALEPGRGSGAVGARLRCAVADRRPTVREARRRTLKIRALRAERPALNATSSSKAKKKKRRPRTALPCVEPELLLASPEVVPRRVVSASPATAVPRSCAAGGNLTRRSSPSRTRWARSPSSRPSSSWGGGSTARGRSSEVPATWAPALAAVQSRLDRNPGSADAPARGDGGDDGGPASRAAAYGEAVDRAAGHQGSRWGGMPAIPEIACDSPWIAKEPGAFLGIKDREHVVVGARARATRDDRSSRAARRRRTKTRDGSEDFATLTRAEGSVSCCATVNFACDEGVVWQVDLDRDPRYAHWRERKKVVDVSDVPRVAGEPSVVDVAATSSNVFRRRRLGRRASARVGPRGVGRGRPGCRERLARGGGDRESVLLRVRSAGLQAAAATVSNRRRPVQSAEVIR